VKTRFAVARTKLGPANPRHHRPIPANTRPSPLTVGLRPTALSCGPGSFQSWLCMLVQDRTISISVPMYTISVSLCDRHPVPFDKPKWHRYSISTSLFTRSYALGDICPA
jgi:hypothetical protein